MKPFLMAPAVIMMMTCCSRGLGAVEYTGKGLRDPFVDASASAADTASAAPKISGMDLQGIVLAPHAEPRAIIDGVIVKAGSRLKSGEVKQIEKSGVTISYNGTDYFLPDKGRTLYANTSKKIQPKQG